MRQSFAGEISTSFFLAIVFAILAIFLGFVLGGVFGAAEDSLKNGLNQSATEVLDSVYKSDVAAKDAVVKKSWEYFKRAHMHWGAIGSAALALILTLVLVCRPTKTARFCAVVLGSGALIYPSFWLLAGIYAPQMGGTGIAKEHFAWIGTPGAAFCILGVAGTLFCLVRDRFTTIASKSV